MLLVADAPWIRNDVAAGLSELGYSLAEETDPYRIEDSVVEHRPDVVVVDLQVGTMGGMALTRAIKNMAMMRDDLELIPVVVLLDRSADAFLARRAGADGWVEKPFYPQQLRAAITAAMERLPSGGVV